MKTHWFFACIVLILLASCTNQLPENQETNIPIGTEPTQENQTLLTPTITMTSASAATATERQAVPTAAAETQAAPAATDTPMLTATATDAAAASTATQAAPERTLTLTATMELSGPANEGGILVDHTMVDLFEQIPDEYLRAARELNMMYMDQSVGVNINQGLDCLASASWERAGAHCRRDYTGTSGSEWLWKTYAGSDLQAGSVPAQIRFQPDPNRYNRANWTFVAQMGTWQEYLQSFLQVQAPALIDEKDVLSFQFTYLHVAQGSDIADPQEGFFSDQPHDGYYQNRERWDISDLREYQAQNPNKVFIYWTTSLARGIGSAESTAFNDQMRQYALANQMPLFDAADILSHDPDGNPCYDNRDGVEYCSRTRCENHPDDGQNHLAICQAYTTELEGGHLGSVSGGKIQLAKAFWVLMAQIAGWQP
jgi:hypothetical protein